MSRGPGRIERAIERIMDAEPDSAFTVGDLCWRVFPAIQAVERKHRVSVLRAIEKVTARSEGWRVGLTGNGRKGAPVALYNSRSRESVACLLAHGLRRSTTPLTREAAKHPIGDRMVDIARRRVALIDALVDEKKS